MCVIWFGLQIWGADDGDGHNNGDVQVNTADGPVRGGWLKASSGAQLASYQGIPFAAPPLGNLRFAFHQSLLAMISFLWSELSETAP